MAVDNDAFADVAVANDRLFACEGAALFCALGSLKSSNSATINFFKLFACKLLFFRGTRPVASFDATFEEGKLNGTGAVTWRGLRRKVVLGVNLTGLLGTSAPPTLEEATRSEALKNMAGSGGAKELEAEDAAGAGATIGKFEAKSGAAMVVEVVVC